MKVLISLVELTSRQRKIKRAFFHESLLEGTMNVMDDDDQETLIDVARLVGVLADKPRKPREPGRDRNLRKQQWDELYRQKSDDEFVESPTSRIFWFFSFLFLFFFSFVLFRSHDHAVMFIVQKANNFYYKSLKKQKHSKTITKHSTITMKLFLVSMCLK